MVRQRSDAGFTLLEVLVVLVITSLIMTLLMQGLSYVLQLRGHVGGQLEYQYRTALQEGWYRDLVAGLYPDHRGHPDLFRGEADRLSGLSAGTLSDFGGMPVRFELRLQGGEDGPELHYSDTHSGDWVLAAWDGATEAAFSYLDGQGGWHSHWPPKEGDQSQLPVMVRLAVAQEPIPVEWLAAVNGRREARIDTTDLLGF